MSKKKVELIVKFQASVPGDLNINEICFGGWGISLCKKGEVRAIDDVIWTDEETLSIKEIE